MIDLLTIEQAYQRLQADGATGISRYCLRGWIDQELIPHVKNGNRKLVSYSDIEAYVNNNKVGGYRP